MKSFLFGCLCLLFVAALPVSAQQHQVQRRTNSVLAFPQFKDATVHFSFMRKGQAKANIFLKDSGLLFMQDSTVMQANLGDVISVDFDSVQYMRVSKELGMGRVVAGKDNVFLLCVTTLDLKSYNSDASKGENLPYFNIDGFDMFLEINGDFREEAKGYPLQDKYYFLVRGDVVPAVERLVKKKIRADKKGDFKVLMADRFWSWKDAESLTDLLDYF
jgi:hypothetical protein